MVMTQEPALMEFRQVSTTAKEHKDSSCSSVKTKKVCSSVSRPQVFSVLAFKSGIHPNVGIASMGPY